MVDRDAAFLWETEALRSESGPSPGSRPFQTEAVLDAADWLTLREASEATGVPTDTIRKWARHENVPSFLEKTDDGHLRLVSLSGIRHWADEIGRELKESQASDEPSPHLDAEVDLTAHEHETIPDVPEGSMLVPLDAWNKMLNQLGNLHEAGQQLAEARERAAKAETEARFLKERLADLREELERTRETAASLSEPRQKSEDQTEATATHPQTTLGGTAASLARKLYQGWRQKRSS